MSSSVCNPTDVIAKNLHRSNYDDLDREFDEFDPGLVDSDNEACGSVAVE